MSSRSHVAPLTPPPQRRVVRAALIAVLALAGLAAAAGAIGLPTAAAQTTVLSATLTYESLGNNLYGCDNSVSGKECSDADVLTEDEFTYDGATLTVTRIVNNSSFGGTGDGTLEIDFSGVPSSDTEDLLLRIGSYKRLLSERDSISQAGKRFTYLDTEESFNTVSATTFPVSLTERAANQVATEPRVRESAEGAGVLFADTSTITDGDGFQLRGGGVDLGSWSYEWLRVDGSSETRVGVDSPQYQTVAADEGKQIKVRVSFTDGNRYQESPTSALYGPIRRPTRPPVLPLETTLVSNLDQLASPGAAYAQLAQGFRLGSHGQGYELSAVELPLAAVPSSLTVSLWIGGVPSVAHGADVTHKLFDFNNPRFFRAGLNRFTAPPGAFLYQNVNYFVVLSDFGSEISLSFTPSDDEDDGGETGAVIFDITKIRGLNSTGRWQSPDEIVNVLRMAVHGYPRTRGILAATYAQPARAQEHIAAGDQFGWRMVVGGAERYLIRGFSILQDGANQTGGIANPYELMDGSTSLFRLTSSRYVGGLNLYTAPRGSTVVGSKTYDFEQDVSGRLFGYLLTRVFGPKAGSAEDTPTAPGVTLALKPDGDVSLPTVPYMAVIGEPLNSIVRNLDQSSSDYVALSATRKFAAQAFSTRSRGCHLYRLDGIGVTIQDGGNQLPDDASSVTVSLHLADSTGRPQGKLFDLISPDEYAAGLSYFEAPEGMTLTPNTDYAVVWQFREGTAHRVQRTSSNAEDAGALSGFLIADTSYHGNDLNSLSAPSNTHSLQIAVYGGLSSQRHFGPECRAVTKQWRHLPPDLEVGREFRLLFVTLHGIQATSTDIEDYNALVQREARGEVDQDGDGVADLTGITHRVIRRAASQFKAVVCTPSVDARDHIGMAEDPTGVSIYWLGGGWADRPRDVARTYDDFLAGVWSVSEYGSYVTGNEAYFYPENYEPGSRQNLGDGSHMIWTGCGVAGTRHPSFPMGSTSGQVSVGTPLDTTGERGPLGALQGLQGQPGTVTSNANRYKQIYGISPIFTVVE